MRSIFVKLKLCCVLFVGMQISKTLAKFLWHYVFAMHYEDPINNYRKYGEWAIITGGTNGLGLAFFEIFASQGINIVLIDRDLQLLQLVSKDLGMKHQVKTITIQSDWSCSTQNYKTIQKAIIDLDIGVLVNNVHANYPHPDYFLDLNQPEKTISKVINGNIYSVTSMCKLVLPGMIKRHRGLIINISSFVVDMPAPMLTVYAASKAFVDKFSLDLQTEHKNDNIVVFCICPGFIDSRWLTTRHPTWMAPSAVEYLESAMSHFGIHNRTIGYYPHTLFVRVANLIHYVMPSYGQDLCISYMKGLRENSIRGFM